MYTQTKFDRAVANLPNLYNTEDISLDEKIVKIHLFIGNSDWYIVEGDAEEGVLFGYAILGGDYQNAEWGYVSIDELKEISVGGFEIDFDLYWNEKPFKEVNLPG